MDEVKRRRLKKVAKVAMLGVVQAIILISIINLFGLSPIWGYIVFIISLGILAFVEVKYFNLFKLEDDIIEEIVQGKE